MTNSFQETIVAPATIPGTGAISIVRLSGPDCFRIADTVVSLKSGTISGAKPYTIHFGEVNVQGQLLDQVLVSVFRAPHSYTGEDAVEISTHASSYIVQELISLLLAAGARMANAGEFTRRAFLNGKMDLSQAEAVADVIASTTSASHRVAMNQLRGGFSAQLDSLREQLLQMASLLELELDFSEEDVEFAERGQLLSLTEETLAHVSGLAASFRLGNMIKNGVPVAIVGAANTGKSTLLNALLGEERAIVSDIPGTTRDTIEETLNLEGILFRFVDTAGIRESADKVERIGIERTFCKMAEAEVVLVVLDASNSEGTLLQEVQQVVDNLDRCRQKLIILLNKCDLVGLEGVNKNVISINNFVSYVDIEADILLLSAKTGKGLEELKNALLAAEKELIPNAESTFVTNIRHFEALQLASSSLQQCRTSLSRGLSSDLVAEDLRSALAAINTILGKDLGLAPETILTRIFQTHCVGK